MPEFDPFNSDSNDQPTNIDYQPRDNYRVEIGTDTTDGAFLQIAHPPSMFSGPEVARLDRDQAEDLRDALTLALGDATRDFGTLQDQVHNWSQDQFGQQPPSYPLVGAAEELGETSEAYLDAAPSVAPRIRMLLELYHQVGLLSHSILKRTQNIRLDERGVGGPAEIEAAEQIQSVLGEVMKSIHDAHNPVSDPGVEPTPEITDGVADTCIYLGDFAGRLGMDLQTAVDATWQDVVSTRDWDADKPEDGDEA